MSPGSRLQRRVLRPTTVSKRTSSTLPETPVYHAGQTVQKLRFPGRRKVVKKYGKGNSEPSPRQRTLTQIGYILHEPQYDLQELKTVADADGGGPQLSWEVDIDANAGADCNKAKLSRKQSEHTQRKRRSKEACDTTRSVLATPATVRTEIPSSQPSPFTPMLLLDRWSPSDDTQSSPLQDKGLELVSGCGLDADGVARKPKDHPGHLAKKRKSNQALERQSSLSDLNSHSKTVCNSQERSRIEEVTCLGNSIHSSSHGGLERGATLQNVCSSQDDGGDGLLTHGHTRRAFQRRISSPGPAEEIPDTDDEEDKGKASSRPAFRTLAATPQRAASTAGNKVIPSESPISSLDLSSPSEMPRTPSPRLRGRRLYTAGRIKVHQAEHGAGIGRGQTRTTSRTAFPWKTDEGAATSWDAKGDEPRSTSPNVVKRNGSRLETLHQLGPGSGRQPDGKQQHVQSQGSESQRVPLDIISRFKPHTDRTDIIICTDPAQLQGMVDGTRDHELRSFKIPQTVCRFWIYVTEPVCELQYMAVVAGLQHASEIDNHGGIGNTPNAGSMAIQFAYRLLQVYQLNNPVPLGTMKKNGWMDGPPTRYTYIPPAVVGSLLGNLRCAIVDNTQNGGVGLDDTLPCSQGAETRHTGPMTGIHSYLGEAIPVTTGDYQRSAVGGTSKEFLDPEIVAVAREGHGKVTQCQKRACQATMGSAPATQVQTAPIGLSQDTRSVPTATRPNEPIPSATFCEAANTLSSEETQRSAAVAQTNTAMQARWRRMTRHGIQPQVLALTEARVSQLDLPDSLYEEMRQAPPAVVLDSDDSEDE